MSAFPWRDCPRLVWPTAVGLPAAPAQAGSAWLDLVDVLNTGAQGAMSPRLAEAVCGGAP